MEAAVWGALAVNAASVPKQVPEVSHNWDVGPPRSGLGGGDVKWQISFGAVVLWDSAMYITKRNLELRQLTAVPV